MSDTKTEDPAEREHEQEIAGLLPTLAQLDRTATELEQKTAAGQEVTAADISAYQQQAAHAQHLVQDAAADAKEISAAEKEHRGDGERGFATRALDHANHPRHFEPTPADAGSDKDRERDDEQEIDL
ncbi:hypothetical protein [Streptomyces sp. RLA2-12]|uniref:hypothetical protein n=1 Tax=Streptomyces sp. RLA2-12 TaxID=2721242 RepID=UPI00145D4015|nr:hypothetical protein [Streptomyces sp. RLA2-12]NMI63146.1 hypothetical protein [Streptomyces sp. RLA2-12]